MLYGKIHYISNISTHFCIKPCAKVLISFHQTLETTEVSEHFVSDITLNPANSERAVQYIQWGFWDKKKQLILIQAQNRNTLESFEHKTNRRFSKMRKNRDLKYAIGEILIKRGALLG